TFTGGIITGIAVTSEFTPKIFSLEQNYPNPFNPVTIINYELKVANFVSLSVYDVLGNKVRNLLSEKQKPGRYSVNFNASDLPSGIYYYKLKAGNFEKVRKLMLLK
ncbi:MAG: T9SS type A sorting domain-containing protein, partial [Ignavibacteria bacterium]